MNYDRVILELMDRVCQLEEEVASLKQQLATSTEPSLEPVVETPVRVGRDTTKYELDGVRYGKSRVALAIVKEYLKRHPEVTASAQLTAKGVFEKALQGSMAVIRPLAEAKTYAGYEKRFFCSDDEMLSLDDGVFVVSSQWSANNVDRLINRAKELGIDVTILNWKTTV